MTNLKPEEAAMRGLLGVGLIVGLVCMLAGIERAVAGTAPALPMANGSSAAMHNAEGIKHYNLGHWKPAYEHFVEAVQENPDAAEAHYNLALSLDKMGEHQEAAKHFKHAQKLGKDNPDIQNSGILKAHVKMLK